LDNSEIKGVNLKDNGSGNVIYHPYPHTSQTSSLNRGLEIGFFSIFEYF